MSRINKFVNMCVSCLCLCIGVLDADQTQGVVRVWEACVRNNFCQDTFQCGPISLLLLRLLSTFFVVFTPCSSFLATTLLLIFVSLCSIVCCWLSLTCRLFYRIGRLNDLLNLFSVRRDRVKSQVGRMSEWVDLTDGNARVFLKFMRSEQ